MKRLSLLAFTTLLVLGCQRSEANSAEPVRSNPLENEGPNLTRLTSCFDADEWTCEVEAAVVRLTNEKRAALKLSSLDHVFETSHIARGHSVDMETKGISHDGFKERFELLNRILPGIGGGLVGENVAMFSNGSDDVERVAAEFVRMWWGSQGHKANMISPDVQYLGVGVSRGADDRVFATQMFH